MTSKSHHCTTCFDLNNNRNAPDQRSVSSESLQTEKQQHASNERVIKSFQKSLRHDLASFATISSKTKYLLPLEEETDNSSRVQVKGSQQFAKSELRHNEKNEYQPESLGSNKTIPETTSEFSSSDSSLQTHNKHDTVTMEYVDRCLACLKKLDQPVTTIAGIGPKTKQSLNELGLFTLRDLLWYFPRSFIDRTRLQRDVSAIPDGELGTFVLKVHGEKARHNVVPCTDEMGNPVNVVFLYGNSRRGTNIVNAKKAELCERKEVRMIVSGRVKSSEKGYAIINPEVITSLGDAKDVLGIEPVYRLCSGLSQSKLIKAIDGALEVAEELRLLPESLPLDVLAELNWPGFVDAIVIAHKPKTLDEAGVVSPARCRLAFEELCIQQAQLTLTRWKLKYSDISGVRIAQTDDFFYSTWQDSPLVSKAVQSLPFKLTRSQISCLHEIWNDAITCRDGRMARLLQGDVGSGKTVLAYLLGLGCIESRQGGGSVVALLAPTQLLALQHYQTISDFAHTLNKQNTDSKINNIGVALLTGDIVGNKRNEVLSRLEHAGEADAIFLVGTHALITPGVVERLRNLSSHQSKGLALCVIDEEQRFGVRQRDVLASCAANTLFMSATPIPRTVGLQESGLLDVTHLECEPRTVETTITSADNLEKVIGVLRTKINNYGSKCFWVLPRIGGNKTCEDSDSLQSTVLSRYAMLRELLGNEKVGYIHGRMKIEEREEQLARFADQASAVNVLVSTTVIEVGIDVPNVDILIVENADRFGLSALHQLRGRIGRRGSHDLNCHCLLISDEAYFNDAAGSSLSLKRLGEKDMLTFSRIFFRCCA